MSTKTNTWSRNWSPTGFGDVTVETARNVTVDETRAVDGLCEHKCTSSANFTFIWEKCWPVKSTRFMYWSTTMKLQKRQIYWRASDGNLTKLLKILVNPNYGESNRKRNKNSLTIYHWIRFDITEYRNQGDLIKEWINNSIDQSSSLKANSSSAVQEITHFNPLNTKRRLLYLKTQLVPRSKHFSSRL